MAGRLVGSLIALGTLCWLASPASAQPFPGTGGTPGMQFPYWRAPAPQAMPLPTAPVYAPPQRVVHIPVYVGATDFTRVNLPAEAAGEAASPKGTEKPQTAPTIAPATALALPSDSFSSSRCPSQGGWSAGAGIYYLKPFLADRTAFITTTGAGGAAAVSTGTAFDWSYAVSPLVWLAYTGEGGLGVQLRYFRYDQSSNDPSTSNPDGTNNILQSPGLPDPELFQGGTSVSLFNSPVAAGDVLTFGSDIRIETLDLEVTRHLSVSQVALMLSAGARYLQSAMNYRGVLVNPAVPITETVAFGHNYYAAGPTLCLGGYWYLDEDRWAVYFSTRGSLLVGNSRQTFSSSQQDVASITNVFTQLDDAVVPIGEIELGLAWTPDLGDMAAVVQAAVVNQTYFGVGSPSRLGGDLSLFGFQVSFGVGY